MSTRRELKRAMRLLLEETDPNEVSKPSLRSRLPHALSRGWLFAAKSLRFAGLQEWRGCRARNLRDDLTSFHRRMNRWRKRKVAST